MAQITSTELGAVGRYVNLGTPAALTNLVQSTIITYCRPANAGQNNFGYMYSKCPSDGKGPRFYLNALERFGYGNASGATLSPTRVSTDARTPYMTWQHLVVTHDMSVLPLAKENIELYYEAAGVMVKETTFTSNLSGSGALFDDALNEVYLLDREGGIRAFQGDVAYVATWNRVLDTTELETVRAGGPLDVPGGLVLLWANQADLSPSAITPVARSTFVAGELPPNTSLGGEAAISPETGSAVFTGYTPEVIQNDPVVVAPATGHVTITGYTPVVSQTNEVIISSPAERGTLLLSACSVTPDGLTPTITLRSRWANDQLASGARAMYGKVAGVNGMTPAFRLSRTQFEGTINTSKKFVFSYDKVTWTEMLNRSNDASYFYFSHDSAFTGNEIYICSQHPWLIEHTLPWIESLEASGYVSEAPSSAGNNYVFETRSATVNELGEAIAAIPLYSFKISSGAGNAPDGQPKRKAVFMAGVHASEDIGNHVLKGAVEFLVSADAQAAIFRNWFDVYVYPLVASAGRQGGAQRVDFQTGHMTTDTNRSFDDDSFETLTKHKAAVQTDCGDTIQVFMDFHGNHLTPLILDFVQLGSDKATWQAAIQTYRAGLAQTDLDSVGTSTEWAWAVKGAPISVIAEYAYYNSYPLSDAIVYGADHVRALSDIADAEYFGTVAGWDSDAQAWNDDDIAWDATRDYLSGTANAVLQKLTLQTASASAVLQQTKALTASASGTLIEQTLLTALASAVLQTPGALTATANALLQKNFLLTAQASANLTLEGTKLLSGQANAVLMQLETVNLTCTASASLFKNVLTAASASAIISRTGWVDDSPVSGSGWTT